MAVLEYHIAHGSIQIALNASEPVRSVLIFQGPAEKWSIISLNNNKERNTEMSYGCFRISYCTWKYLNRSECFSF